jgi:hypothetical protein
MNILGKPPSLLLSQSLEKEAIKMREVIILSIYLPTKMV